VLSKTNINALNFQLTSEIKIIILIKMSIATVVAFLFKFIVDKVVIFQDKESGVKENFRKITVYGFFAIFTTLIFWGFELFFKLCFSFKGSEYFGAVIGLATGYTIKFFLDSKFVFQK
nr:GtrA family protein [Spirochaetota bacterium]